jgi:hypothetical protein
VAAARTTIAGRRSPRSRSGRFEPLISARTLGAAIVGSAIAAALTVACGKDRVPGSPSSTTIRVGDLSVLFQDNSESPAVLSGMQSLFNLREAPGYDAFNPANPGESAGVNFEHIICGHSDPRNVFAPRNGPMPMAVLPDGASVALLRSADHSPWAVDSTLTYTVVAPHYIDIDFRCTAHDPRQFGDRGYAVFFFASYMNNVADVALNFLGVDHAGGVERWIRGDAPPGPSGWLGGGTYRHVDAPNLAYEPRQGGELNLWSYESPRFTRPFYYGLADHLMTYIVMFDRACTEEDEVRLSLFKFKVGESRKQPAWDFQYIIHRVEKGRQYGFRARVVWKRFAGADDCLREYESWVASLAP